MKKNKLLIVLLSLSIFSIISYLYVNYKINNPIISSESNINGETKYLDIYIYDKKSKEYKHLEIEADLNIIDEGDYVNAVIKNSSFYKLNDNYKFLAEYSLKYEGKSILIIKLNNYFSKLNNESIKDFVNSVKYTLRENFKEYHEINVEIDTN
ncbi:hypothetical protein CEP89_00585 [Streptobacillus moniliformis]|uniref:Uncharacterized protein n=1 Tax=Streptobacillus moniliformis (strain ATCC 14647 / DSM 12112 / NCTC 10651 / 9901) TaxID=519441 RepID=D1AY10_STRM9|nr:hypothetical protein [Streptobacillus moniliformis]ACZ01186.1 conserved hypothetical protein [Streptobacillus moniliformis DSM 12112]AVL42456.1 hypothetical protein CEP89_00585 [Streptobacillus moniliformis]SQA13662.1 Uncharacterised protein [Streptobacillus moniliformis]